MSDASKVNAPVAKKVAKTRVHHDDTVVDDYEWLRDKDDPEVIDYLTAQNAVVDADTEDLADLREALFDEVKARTQETDMSVPVRRGAYWYYVRTEEGKQYAIRCRCPIASDDDWTPPSVQPGQPVSGEEVLLDDNVEAEGTEFYSLGAFSVSDDGNLLAYSVDTVGDERYTLRFKDLRSGELLPDEVSDTAPGATFSPDGAHVFYETVDAAWRPDSVWRHDLGSDQPDTKVFHEPDDRYWVGMGSTRSEKYLVISVGSKITSEYWVLDADDPTGEFRVVLPRQEGVEYGVEHAVIDGADVFLILHNRDGENFAIDVAPVDDPAAARTLVAHDPEVRIEDIDAFADHLVLSYRKNALTQLAVAPLNGADVVFSQVEFDSDLYTVGVGPNPEWHSPRLRIGYTSFTEPGEVLEIDVRTGARTSLKKQIVLGGYDAKNYVEKRLWATATDGTHIPVSVVSRVGITQPAPLLLYGYGSYEHSIEPGFSIARLSLLDRGVVFAVAHVRGGGEMGRHWYENGKTLTKKNTFTDFVDVARHLVSQSVTTPDRMVANGGSAGGLLMGAVANLAPEMFTGIVAAVPFVDPLTSILDPDLPLTVIEWDEWGNPLADKEVYDYMKSYAPYENVTAQAYPAILAITSLNDTRVLFTEAAKWVAKLQATTTGDAPILLKTEMNAGHGGVSGRYQRWRENAFEDAWILRQLGITA